jgi:hypothetical protein
MTVRHGRRSVNPALTGSVRRAIAVRAPSMPSNPGSPSALPFFWIEGVAESRRSFDENGTGLLPLIRVRQENRLYLGLMF